MMREIGGAQIRPKIGQELSRKQQNYSRTKMSLHFRASSLNVYQELVLCLSSIAQNKLLELNLIFLVTCQSLKKLTSFKITACCCIIYYMFFSGLALGYLNRTHYQFMASELLVSLPRKNLSYSYIPLSQVCPALGPILNEWGSMSPKSRKWTQLRSWTV